MTTSITTRVDLLRHGEVEGDAVYRGSTDDDLSDHGWQQMVAALDNKQDWDIIISSPLQRCVEFANLIASEEAIDLEINPSLQEIDFGVWEGLSPDEIMKDDADLLHAWWASPTKVTPPDGEDFHDFQARVLKSLKQIIQENKGKKILLVTHAGVIRMILMHALGMQDENLFRLNIDYASFTRLNAYHDDQGDFWSLIQHG